MKPKLSLNSKRPKHSTYQAGPCGNARPPSVAIPILVVGVLAIGPLAWTQPPATADEGEFIPRNTQPNNEGPLLPQLAIGHLQVPAGFQITLAAAEPDVQQPIAIAFDDRGRLWVAESYSYNGSTFTDDKADRILIFEDTDGDAIFDRRSVFCDGLTHLTGLQIGFGGVWITAPPHVAFIPDRNQDDVPDEAPIVHLDGWSLKAEHNSVNGLTWGPDGWLYGRHGIKQPSLVGRPGVPPEKRIELSCCIWRYHPTEHTFEVVADGTINPWGLDFDDYGQGFLTTSVVDHLWHLVPGAHYERWKDRGIHPDPRVYEAMTSTNDHLHWATAAEVKARQSRDGLVDFGGGHSHCDAMIYLGDRWPTAYRGKLLTSNIHGRRLNCDRLVQKAGEYCGVHDDDFLISTDPWFRAVSMEYGPDGDVYVTDWSDNGECHDRDGIHRTSGRIYKVTWGEPLDLKVNLAAAPTERLVEWQLHANDWYVRHARRILQERAAAGSDLSGARRALLEMFANQPEIPKKLRAMWGLNAINALDASWLLAQLDHDSEHIRAWAIRLLVDRQPPAAEAMATFCRMASTDRSWLVRMSLASAMQRIPVGQRFELGSLLARATVEMDSANLQRMIWYALEPEIGTDARRAVAILNGVSPRMRSWIARRLSEESLPATETLFLHLAETQDAKALADMLEGFNAALATVPIERLPAGVSRTAAKLINHPDQRVAIAAILTAAAVGDATTLRDVRQRLHDSSYSANTRQAAIVGLMRRRYPDFAEDLRNLISKGELLVPALQAAATINDDALHQTILDRFDSMNRHERSAAIDALVARRSGARRLLDALAEKRIATIEITATQARQIAALGDDKLTQQLEATWGSTRPTSEDRQQQIKAWTRTLDPSRVAKADMANGQLLFQKNCGNCHRLFGDGKTIGPDLTGSNRKNLSYLLTNIVDPSAAVPVDFRLTNVLTTDGRVIGGIVSQKTASTLTMETATESIQIPSDEIEEIKLSAVSMMPEGLLDKLTEDEVRDLFAWMMGDGALAADSVPPNH